MDRFLEFGAGFDWITPAVALIRQATGSHVAFAVPAEATGHVTAALRGRGIRLHDRRFYRGHFVFSISAAHAQQAEQVLRSL